MRKKHPNNSGDAFYDIYEDWELIESSFLKQYGIRLSADDDLSWREFVSLLSGLMRDTPLGTVVSIRAETDNDILKNFTEDQHRIRNKWMHKHNKGLANLTAMQMELKKCFM